MGRSHCPARVGGEDPKGRFVYKNYYSPLDNFCGAHFVLKGGGTVRLLDDEAHHQLMKHKWGDGQGTSCSLSPPTWCTGYLWLGLGRWTVPAEGLGQWPGRRQRNHIGGPESMSSGGGIAGGDLGKLSRNKDQKPVGHD